MMDLCIFYVVLSYALLFSPNYDEDWYNVTKKGNKLLRHKWWLKNKNKNTLFTTNREFSHCLSRAMVLMLLMMSDFTSKQCNDLMYPALTEQIRQRQLFIQSATTSNQQETKTITTSRYSSCFPWI